MWIWIIIIAVIIGGIVGLISSGDNDDKGSGCLGGALFGGMAAMGCLVRIFFAALSIFVVLWLFHVLFGSCN